MANLLEKDPLWCQFPRQGTSANSLHRRVIPTGVASLSSAPSAARRPRNGGTVATNTPRNDSMKSPQLASCYLFAAICSPCEQTPPLSTLVTLQAKRPIPRPYPHRMVPRQRKRPPHQRPQNRLPHRQRQNIPFP